ncbi:MAG TPA: DUF1697 domain-containing protein, partial [Solirubrobacteraceae bacterium]|nr:DUF1697 domain-containing protein [Solirubrobacteraceae bacterium]
MKTYAVFLRGINVGGRTVKMAELRACLEELGCANVRTILQSGNVVLDSSKSPGALKTTIESGLKKSFGYEAKVQILAIDSLRDIARAYPFKADAERHSYVIFFENGLERKLLAEPTDLDAEVERIAGGDGVIYWQVPIGITLK